MNNRERSFGADSADADPSYWASRRHVVAVTIAGGILVVVVALFCAVVTVDASSPGSTTARQILAVGSNNGVAKPESTDMTSGPVGATTSPAENSSPPTTPTALTPSNNGSENYS
ncbi:hypothetical protein AAGW05_13640, partial [Arthrobacter sp. LAPM80]|uniref:hypothetical protein n=1 Tax=Arthrobacter sp. LAPM80 TaxID=3141788 RepID=UPI00398AEF93